ncbi:DnaJ homolog subfamily C member 17 [Tanacetum coccineum]
MWSTLFLYQVNSLKDLHKGTNTVNLIVGADPTIGLWRESEEGTKLSNEDIKKAYRSKALELHPDKRPDDPNAVVDFQQLQASYDILKDEKTRKEFDNAVMIQVNEQKREQERYENRMKRSERKRMSEVVHPAPEQKKRAGLRRDSYEKNTRMGYDCYVGSWQEQRRRFLGREESKRRLMEELEQRELERRMADREQGRLMDFRGPIHRCNKVAKALVNNFEISTENH